jgi:hypothetical protein
VLEGRFKEIFERRSDDEVDGAGAKRSRRDSALADGVEAGLRRGVVGTF